MGIISDVGSRASFVSAKTLIGCGGHVMRRGEIPINSGQYKQFIIMNNMRQKMLIVGDNEVLKVHFLLQMSGDYDRNSVYIASKFENRVVDVTVYDKTIEVALWDTSGQEDYARLRPLSYPDTSFVLMMFCLESEQTLDNCICVWAPEVTHFCPGVPIILVGVFHCYRSDYDNDTKSARAVTDESANAAAKSIGAYAYYECDLYKRYEVYGALLLGVTAALQKSGYQEHGGRLHKQSTYLGGLFHVSGKNSTLRPPLPNNSDEFLPVAKPITRPPVSCPFSFATLWNNHLFSDITLHHQQTIYHAHAIILYSQCELFKHYRKDVGLTSVSQLEHLIQHSLFFSSVTQHSDVENTELYINDDIPSTTVETLLQCVYHGKTKIQPVTDDVERFDKLCSEFGIKVKHLEDAEWTLELPFNADDLQKILLSGELSDVTFVVEEEKLSVHRAILCCHSDVLLAMLSGAFAEGHQKEVVIQNCRLVSFCCLLEWLYTGRCNFNPRVGLSASREAARFSACHMSDTEMLEVIRLADQYCLSELVVEVEIQLSERIITKIKSFTDETPRVMQTSKIEVLLDEFVDIIRYCEHCGGHKLKEWILLVIATNYHDIWDKWKDSEKASELSQLNKEFIESNIWNRPYLNFINKYMSLYW